MSHTRTFVYILLVLLAMPLPAKAIVGDARGAFGLDGSFRVIGAVSRNYDFVPNFRGRDRDEFLQGIFRLTAGGRPSERLSYEAHLVSTLTYISAGRDLGEIGFARTGVRNRYRVYDETWNWADEERTTGDTWFDRFNFKTAFERIDVTVGRQAITFGKAFFWNPLDVYAPFDPAQFDRDYKPGVDAVRIDLALGDFSGLNLVYVAGRETTLDNFFADEDRAWDADWYGSSVLVRYFTNISGWDAAVQGGKIYGGYQVGGAVSGDFDGLEFRLEAAYFFPEDSPVFPPPIDAAALDEHLAAVVGGGRRFENSLHLETELYYNGAGESADKLDIGFLRSAAGNSVQAGRWFWGVSASYELTPLTQGRLAAIYSLTDNSIQVQPTVTRSLSDNSEFLAGVSLNFGDRPRIDAVRGSVIESEFGAYPHTVFVEYKLYF
jgi:hypothetical protein